MDKIVGKKIIFFVLLFSNFLVQSHSFLRIVDRKGIPIKEAYVDVPFKMELVLENIDRSVRAPIIPGIEALRVEGSETRMNSMNGNTITIYGYHLRAEKPGRYKLGPVDDPVLGHIEAVSFNVRKDVQSDQKEDSQLQPFARLMVDKKNVMVGEKIHFSLRFYYQGDAVTLENIIEPQLQDIHFNNRKGPLAGREKVQKNSYNYLEWEWDASIGSPGTVNVPAYGLDFSTPSEHDENDLFSLFFQRGRMRKRIYSNSLELQVDQLPACSEEVHGIGSFTDFSLRLQPSIAREGEGSVLTLEIVGDNDLATLDIFPLKNMPDALKWYDSKNYSSPHSGNNGRVKKSFEYIIQGLKPGDWEIPSQKFTYFDTKKRSYKTLETLPKILTITPNAMTFQSKQDLRAESLNNAIEARSAVQHDIEGAPIIIDGPIHAYRERIIPWWIFGILLLAPVVVFISRRMDTGYRADNRTIKKQSFDNARTALLAAQKNDSYAQIYPIFLELFKGLFALSETAVNEELIENRLQEKKFSTAQVEAWRLFFLRASEYAFFPTPQEREHHELFNEAHSWLNQFERHL